MKQSIDSFDEYEKCAIAGTAKDKEFFLMARDSMIQRFEYCTDLMRKVLKLYLEEIEKIDIEIASPRGAIREAVKIKLITENEGKKCMDMVINRNLTSHLYHQETAHEIAKQVPRFYELMKTVGDAIKKNMRV